MQKLRNLLFQIFHIFESGTLSVFITLVFLGMFIAIISSWIASTPNISRIPPLFSLLKEREIFIFALGFFASLILCISLAILANKGFSQWIDPLIHGIRSRSFLLALTISTIIFFFCVIVVKIILLKHQKGMAGVVELIDNDPGGIFAILTGLATLYGVLLTLQSVREVRRTIGSFSDLIDRIEKMAKTATHNNPLHILAYTPAIGYLAQPDLDWNKFSEAVRRRPAGKPITKFTCLRESDLEIWHRLFTGRTTLKGKVTLENSDRATRAGEGLINELIRDASNEEVPNMVHRLPANFMPGYYLFFTRERAIIVAPLFLPFPKGAPTQQENIPTVQMIGLETQDRAIIRDINQIYNYYSQLPQSPLGEATIKVNQQDIQNWIENPDNVDATTAIEELLSHLLETFQNSQSGEYRNILSGNSEIELNLEARIKTWDDAT